MGNIQDFVCQENICFDDHYTLDWFSPQNWEIIKLSDNTWLLEKGVVNINKDIKYKLIKKVENSHINKLIFDIECRSVLIKSKIEFIIMIGSNFTTKILIENNNIFINDQIIEFKENFVYHVELDYHFKEYISIMDQINEYKNHQVIKKEDIEIQLFLESKINEEDYFNFKIG